MRRNASWPRVDPQRIAVGIGGAHLGLALIDGHSVPRAGQQQGRSQSHWPAADDDEGSGGLHGHGQTPFVAQVSRTPVPVRA